VDRAKWEVGLGCPLCVFLCVLGGGGYCSSSRDHHLKRCVGLKYSANQTSQRMASGNLRVNRKRFQQVGMVTHDHHPVPCPLIEVIHGLDSPNILIQ
jgi:hypothetical protein